jgi:hypothetical protein
VPKLPSVCDSQKPKSVSSRWLYTSRHPAHRNDTLPYRNSASLLVGQMQGVGSHQSEQAIRPVVEPSLCIQDVHGEKPRVRVRAVSAEFKAFCMRTMQGMASMSPQRSMMGIVSPFSSKQMNATTRKDRLGQWGTAGIGLLCAAGQNSLGQAQGLVSGAGAASTYSTTSTL